MQSRRPIPLLALTALIVSGSARGAVQASRADRGALQVNNETGETEQQFAHRTQWWRNAKFGMFVHWGVYAVPAHGEWYMNNAKVPVADYEKYAAQFDPTQFNADEWARIAKDAGMKYITITSKHHDGFSMFGTKLTSYNIVDATPYHRDPMKALAAACRKQGLRLDFYHSIMDWHQPDYLPRRPWDTRPVENADFNRYIAYLKGELTELLTNYGPIGGIWFDGGWEGDAARNHSMEVVKLIRSLQPGIMINDRADLPEDYSTPEQSIPAGAMPNGRLWETCMTMNGSWGYNADDHDWKSSTDLTRKLIDIASKGGNFLLNVGPTAQGIIPPESVQRLHEIGQWMRRNGDSIYGTVKSPYNRTPFDGRCTVKGNTLYVHVFSWPADGVRLPGLKTAVLGATLLDGGMPVRYRTDPTAAGGSALILEKPERVDPVATTIALRLAGPPEVEPVQTVARPDVSGVFLLRAPDAEVRGNAAHVQGEGDTANIGFWTDPHDIIAWTAQVDRPGRYSVEISYACQNDAAGAEYAVQAGRGGPQANGVVDGTGSWDTFTTVTVGTLDLPAGKQTLEVRPTAMPKYAVMNLRWIRLVPMSG